MGTINIEKTEDRKSVKVRRKVSAMVLVAVLAAFCVLGLIGVYAMSVSGIPDSGGTTGKVNCLVIMPDYNTTAFGNYKTAVTNRIKKVTGLSNATVNVKGMATWEFNCSNVDLCSSFDYIYIAGYDTTNGETGSYQHVGSLTAVSPFQSNHAYDMSYTQEELDSAYAYYADGYSSSYSIETAEAGNDLTAKKVEELKRFISWPEGNKVVEFGDAFASALQNDSSVDSAYVGSSDKADTNETNVAHLYAWAYKKMGNKTMKSGSTEGTEMLANVAKKLTIIMEEVPKAKYPTDDPTYANNSDTSSKLLNYEFCIIDDSTGSESKTYTLEYTTDNNNDGKFDSKTEQLENITIKDVSDTRITVEQDKLQSSKSTDAENDRHYYVMTINAGDSVGLFRWQIKVYENPYSKDSVKTTTSKDNITRTRSNSDPVNASFRYAVQSGECKLQLGKGQEKENIRVLQLVSTTSNTIDLPDDSDCKKYREALSKAGIDIAAKNYGNYTSLDNMVKGLEASVGGSSDKEKVNFEYFCYLEALPEYNVTFTRRTPDASGITGTTGIMEDIRAAKGYSYASSVTSDDCYDYLTSNYDLLILGFDDMYGDVTDQHLLEGIYGYIEAGKAVLFAHDTTSFRQLDKESDAGKTVMESTLNKEWNNSSVRTDNSSYGVDRYNQSAYWGYHINKYYRNILGMDRFGVSTVDTDKTDSTESGIKTAAANEFIAANKEQISADKDYCKVTYTAALPYIVSTRSANQTPLFKIENNKNWDNNNGWGTITDVYGNQYSLRVYKCNGEYYIGSYSDRYTDSPDTIATLSKEMDKDRKILVPADLTTAYYLSTNTWYQPSRNASMLTEKPYGYWGLTYYKLSGNVYTMPQNSGNTSTGTTVASAAVTRYANQGYTAELIQDINAHKEHYSYTAQLVNVGDINTYPYNVVESSGTKYDFFNESKSAYDISVAHTHCQYYQLDLEDEDIVVWYTLAGNLSYYNNSLDGRNLYYIYSKGNITYSGIGDRCGAGNLNEVKLFANTFVSSYRSANAGITLEVTNWDASESAMGGTTRSYYTMNVDYLGGSTTSGGIAATKNSSSTLNYNGGSQASGTDIVYDSTTNTQYKRVYFKIRDNTVSNNKKMTVRFYSVDKVPKETDDDTNSVTAGTDELAYYGGKIYERSTGNAVANDKLEAMKEYYIYVPISTIQKQTNVQAVIISEGSGTGSSTYVSTDYYYTYITLNNERWFNLG